jgi:nucleoside-diphosphate-sugar epimerase
VANKKVLVAGASGVVGWAAVQHFARLPGWEVVGLSRRVAGRVPGATLMSVDLTDRDRCAAAASSLGDVTHLVYTALYEKPGLVQGWLEEDHMETNLRMLQNLFDPLLARAAGLEHVSLLQGTKAYGVHITPSPIPARERWPRHPHRNFYFLQEDHLRDAQRGSSWSWTILRPQVIFGESVGSPMNLIPAIGAYGAVLREAELPLSFPGGASSVQEAVDADLLARALAWAATSPSAANQIFNVTNGDVFVWRHAWPAIADALGMEPGGDRPMRLAVEMPAREAEWAAVVDRHGLRSPARLADFVGDSFVYADTLFAYGVDTPRPPQLVSTIKIRQAGFGDCIDTEDRFRKWFDRLQRSGLLPPRHP